MRRERGGLSLVTRARIAAAGVFAVALNAGALCPAAAWAGDGDVEIGQTCAITTGCFPGDAPGFPVTIDGGAGRKYRLTSDLSLPDANTNGIVIGADGITLDLGGFALIGPVVCSGNPLSCTPTGGSGVGIAAASPAIHAVSVHDGAISGHGQAGIRLGEATILRALRVRSNGGGGVEVGTSSIVTDSVVSGNGDDGIVANGSRVTGIIVSGNGGDGILASFGTIERCEVARNRGIGISVEGAVVHANLVEANHLDGILDLGNSLVLRNASNANLEDGIETGAGTSLLGNVARGNGGFGLKLVAGSSFRENTISSATTSTVSNAGGADLGANTCNGVSTCP